MMSYLLNNQQKFNDLVFENRNKNYGAYAIRSAYGNTVFKSLFMVCLSFFVFAFIAYLLTGSVPDIPVIEAQTPPATTTTVYLMPEKTAEPLGPKPRQPRQAPPAGSAAPGTRVVDTLAVETNLQSIQENPPALVSNVTGTAGFAAIPGQDGNGPGNGPGGSANTTQNDKVEDLFRVNSEPEFEGGLKALYQFVSSRLKYPERAIESGREGTVYVKFVVDEKGKVGNLSLQNSLGFGLDEEALRVVSMIPDFKTPAKIGNQAVKVYYQLPIRFKYR